MYETTVTLTGNAATAVDYRQTATGVPVARLRLAATPRRWDKARERWTDGETSFYTVWAWRALADNVAASVSVGEPLVVHGRLRVREGQPKADRGGYRPVTAEVDAYTVGHDLSRGTSVFRRGGAMRTALVARPEGPEAGPSLGAVEVEEKAGAEVGAGA